MWSGADVPEGWALCDGTNGTPDLRGRFVLGASATHAIGSTGGSETVTLTVAQMPKHSHGEQLLKNKTQQPYTDNNISGSYSGQAVSASNITASTGGYVATSDAGGGTAHENMPPYYTLAYIMKL